MKAKLIYDCSDPDEAMALLCAVKSQALALFIWDLTHNTKKGLIRQYEDIENSEDVIGFVYDKIYELLDDNNINIDELTE